ncbi:SPOR domain-containing protein [Tardibacter chloracetimidivorans]|nr:SPOR domain-containing protein [Tardibacter chloracetimidivorans]
MRSVRSWLALAIAAGLATPALAGVEDGVRKWRAGDYAGAVAEWKEPAAKGNRDAQFNLGQAYKLGRGVAADPQKAIEFYRKAADQGHEPAEANLGWILFQTGRREEALPMLQRAAGRGDAHSQYLLGVAYFNGDVVPKDWFRAYRLMTAAAASGLPQARDALNAMDARIPLADRQRALASVDKPPARRAIDESAASSRAATAAPPAAAAQQAGKGLRVQLGAFSSRAAATSAWSTLTGGFTELRSLSPFYVTAGEMIRLQAGPVPDRAAATRICARLTAAGKGCFPVQN